MWVCVHVCMLFFFLPRGQLNLGHFSTRNKLSLPHQGLAVNFSPSKALVARKEGALEAGAKFRQTLLSDWGAPAPKGMVLIRV